MCIIVLCVKREAWKQIKKAAYPDAEEDECTKCYTSRKQNNGIRKMTDKNYTDPFPDRLGGFNWNLFKINISVVEEMITSPILTIFKAYILPSGTYKYQGNVINYEQNVPDFAKTLPRKIEGLPLTIVVRKSNARFPNGYKDFRVRRKVVETIIEYIWQSFKVQCPDATIDNEYLNELLEDENVQNRITITTEDDIEEKLKQSQQSQNNELTNAEVNGSGNNGVVDTGTSQIDINNSDSSNGNNCDTQMIDENNGQQNNEDVDSDDDDDDEFDEGPEQGGATGIPMEEQDDVREEYVPQPIQQEFNVDEALKEFLLNPASNYDGDAPLQGDVPLQWPAQSSTPVSDYNTPGLQSMAFPLLFPHQLGDITLHDRKAKVKILESNKHLLYYCVEKPAELGGGFYYPFAHHRRWSYWAQNTVERHRVSGQRQVYWKKNPEQANMSQEEIQKILDDKDEEKIRSIMSGLSMYSGNILGSDAYFSRARKELEAMFDCLGMPTCWFTFSMADNHWYDLHKLSGIEYDGNEEEKAKKRRAWVRENQHFVDDYFHLRMKQFFKCFFEDR